jgi:acetyl-CoA carboxylase biotin carboxylase subunit
MFRRILVANRGEVAVRVLRTCRRMGIECVAVASLADRDLSWLSEADEVVTLGPARAAQSYLDQDAVLEAARRSGATAIHPGWGFLAENATFAARCESAGLTFIGPPSHVIRQLGDKVAARSAMRRLGVPVIPGSDGALESLEEARSVAAAIGYPVLLKAVAGGGGRGMRRVYSEAEIEDAWDSARAEARAAFGDPTMYLEKLIVGGRHIEFQVLADRAGNAVHFGERECSIQRRHQKLLEEAPSPAVSDALRAEMGARVAGALARLGYYTLGTVEMLLDDSGELFFLEVNTRLQVEHPITEMIYGVDLVAWQLRVAAGHTLDLDQAAIAPSGHAVELRINAEDPELDFRPDPGRLERLTLPAGEGIRVETHLRQGDAISPHYDSMFCKLVVRGADRQAALDRAVEALDALEIEGVTTTAGLHRRILALPAFRAGDYDTTTLESTLTPPKEG